MFTTKSLLTTGDLVTACQAKRMINTCQSLPCSVESDEASRKVLSFSLACKEKIDDVTGLIGKHQDLLQEVQGLPSKRIVEHEIQLISDAPLSNLGMY